MDIDDENQSVAGQVFVKHGRTAKFTAATTHNRTTCHLLLGEKA